MGRILIESAGVDWIIAEGVDPATLRGGPGNVIGSAMPGQIGNAVLSGHRTTNGAPFYHLDRVQIGDLIVIDTLIGRHEFAVTDVRIVAPTDTWVATQWDDGAWLTLTTCNPLYSSRERLVVFAALTNGPNAEVIHSRFGSPTIGSA